jgi:hypothetical protein
VRSLDKQAKAGASSGVGFGRLGWEIRQGERERERCWTGIPRGGGEVDRLGHGLVLAQNWREKGKGFFLIFIFDSNKFYSNSNNF